MSFSDSFSESLPPPLPECSEYTPYWCEENIYLLSQKFLTSGSITQYWDVFVVFVSNQSKQVALWSQKMNPDNDIVIWDYHVILLLRSRRREKASVWVYDFDTRLAIPCSLKDYLHGTFKEDVPPQYASLFRVVPAHLYLNNFASDRSHMLSPSTSLGEPVYLAPPPPYPPLGQIHGKRNNLMASFVNVRTSEDTYGDVLDINGISCF